MPNLRPNPRIRSFRHLVITIMISDSAMEACAQAKAMAEELSKQTRGIKVDMFRVILLLACSLIRVILLLACSLFRLILFLACSLFREICCWHAHCLG